MARARKTETCPVEAYARAVVAGEIVAGRLVRLACRRHLDDLAHGYERGLRWDQSAVTRVLAFFSFLRLPVAGQLDGKAFDLEPFQVFVIGSLFGWKGFDGYRRFRTAYVEQGKGNGKTPLAAGIGLYGLVGDDEASAEVYAAATKLDQAKILFRDAKQMAEASPSLRRRLKVDLLNIGYAATDSFFRPVSSEKRGLDGPRPHMGLIDELHEHPEGTVVDKIRAGTKARRQALIFEITNSGHNRATVCWAHREYSAKVLEGHLQDDSWFAYVCQLDPCEPCREAGKEFPDETCPKCDRWDDEEVWPKVNPGLGSILPAKYLREQVREAKGMPAKEGIVKRLNFCIWTSAVTRALRMDRWDECVTPVDAATLKGRPCFAGLDIGATSDFTAVSLLFAHDDGETATVKAPQVPGGEEVTQALLRRSYSVLWSFWLPEHPVKRDQHMEAVIESWRRAGLVRTTPGEVVDYDQVFNDIVELDQTFGIVKLAMDRGFQGVHLGTRLLSHFGDRLVSFPQGLLSMAAPFRELQELVIQKRFHHGSNPVARWMASNTAAETRGGLSKPSKEHSTEKIDGITAATMGLGVAMSQPVGDADWYTPGILTN